MEKPVRGLGTCKRGGAGGDCELHAGLSYCGSLLLGGVCLFPSGVGIQRGMFVLESLQRGDLMCLCDFTSIYSCEFLRASLSENTEGRSRCTPATLIFTLAAHAKISSSGSRGDLCPGSLWVFVSPELRRKACTEMHAGLCIPGTAVYYLHQTLCSLSDYLHKIQ